MKEDTAFRVAWYIAAMVCNLASGVCFTLVWLFWPEKYK